MNRSVEKKRLRDLKMERDAYRAVAINYATGYHESNPDVGMGPSEDEIEEEVDEAMQHILIWGSRADKDLNNGD